MTYEDNVTGVVIGTMYRSGRLYYEDRPQGGKVYGIDDAEVEAKLRARLEGLKVEIGLAWPVIYPRKVWEIRIFN